MRQSDLDRWDWSRFLKTLSYFGAVPILSQMEWFQQMMGSKVDSTTPAPAIAQPKTVAIVITQLGPFEKALIQHLRARSWQLKVLTIAPEANKPLSDELGITPLKLDCTQPEILKQTLTDALNDFPNGLIDCTASGSIAPDALEPSGAVSSAVRDFQQHGLQILAEMSPQTQAAVIFDFQKGGADLAAVWGAVDDVVMGGVSQSNLTFSNGLAYFSGQVSTANSGGFASVRTRNFQPPLQLGAFDGLTLRVKGDGNRYKAILRTADAWDSLAYCCSFDTQAGIWQTVKIPFKDMIPVFRARTVPSAPPLEADRITAIQLMLSKFEYDGALNPAFRSGPFQLQIAEIGAYGPSCRYFLISPVRDQIIQDASAPSGLVPDLALEARIKNLGWPYTILRTGPVSLTGAIGQPSQTLPAQDPIHPESLAQLCLAALEHSWGGDVTFSIVGQPTARSDDPASAQGSFLEGVQDQFTQL